MNQPTSENSNSSAEDSSSSDDDSSSSDDDSSCSNDSNCNSESSSDDSEESETSAKDEKEAKEGRPAPDSDPIGGSPGQMAIITSGRVGSDEKKNQESGLAIKKSGGVIDPVDDANTSSTTSLKDAETAISMGTGGAVDAPDRKPKGEYIPSDQEFKDALIRAGGGHTDPSPDSGTPTNSPNSPLTPIGPDPVAQRGSVTKAEKAFLGRLGAIRAAIRALEIQ